MLLVIVANQENESIEPSFIESIEKALKDDQALVKSYEGNQGILFKLNLGGKSYLIKRANKSNVFLRYFNQRTLNRELEIYKKLKGIDGIPNCFGMTWRGELILEYIEGQSYRDKQYELAGDQSFFQKLLDLILNMHNEGVAHGDLKRKDNVLVNQDNEPVDIAHDPPLPINVDGEPCMQTPASIEFYPKQLWIRGAQDVSWDKV